MTASDKWPAPGRRNQSRSGDRQTRAVAVIEEDRGRRCRCFLVDHYPLTELVLLTMGPTQVIAEEFSGIDRLQRLLVFGSWAAGYHGQAGPPPHDIDVPAVGDVARSRLSVAAQGADKRLGLPVYPVLASTVRWDDDTDPLISQIEAGPFVEIELVAR